MVYGTTQIFFDDWPESALKEVSNQFLKEMKLEHKPETPNYFACVHQSVRRAAQEMKTKLRRTYHITPKNFVDFGKIFKKMFNQKTK